MEGEFIPSLEEGDFAVETRVLTGSNLNTTIESTQKAAHVLKTQFPEVKQIITKIGSRNSYRPHANGSVGYDDYFKG